MPACSRPPRPAPRLGLVGHLLAAHGRVTTTTEVMAELLRADGVEVLTTSDRLHPGARLVDTVWSLMRWKGQVDLLLVSVYSGRSFVLADLTVATARLRGLPLVLVLHGGGLPDQFERHPRWARRVLRPARAVVAPSPFLASAAGTLGVESEVIPNPLVVEPSAFRLRDRLTPRLLWMRTFHRHYEPELAVRTLAMVRERFVDATLTMAGADDDQLQPTRALVDRLGLSDAVTFPGFLDAAAKARQFDAHDVFLNTNRVDNAPVSVIEAAAHGLPIVATAVGGIPQLLDDRRTALLVPPSDPAAMARAVVELIEDPRLAAALSRAGRHLAERSAWPAVRAQWFELFDRLLT